MFEKYWTYVEKKSYVEKKVLCWKNVVLCWKNVVLHLKNKRSYI